MGLFSVIKWISRKYLKKPIVFQRGLAKHWIKGHNDLFFITSSSSYRLFKSQIDPNSSDLTNLLNPSLELSDLQKVQIPSQTEWIVGIGGGRIMDVAKYLAKIHKKKLCLIPSILSTTSWANMAIALRSNNELIFPATNHADICIVDPEIILQAPYHLSLAGLVDVLVAVSAITDWELELLPKKKHVNPKIREEYLFFIHRVLSSSDVLKHQNEASLQQIMNFFLESLALCGASRSGRPLEGSEHYFYYQLDLLSNTPLIHGPVIALGILISLRLQDKLALLSWEIMKDFFDELKIPYKLENLNVSVKILRECLANMPHFCESRGFPPNIYTEKKNMLSGEELTGLIEWIKNF